MPKAKRRLAKLARGRRLLSVLLAPLAVAVGPVIVGPTPAYACSCIQQDLGSLAKTSAVVFVGTPATEHVDGNVRTYQVRASDVYKGSPSPVTTVQTEQDGAACGINLELDTQYVIIGSENGDQVSTTICSGTRPVTDRALAEVTDALGPATPYRGPQTDVGNEPSNGTEHGTADSDNLENGNDNTDHSASGDQQPPDEPATGRSSTSYVMIGTLLTVAIGISFLVPRLRRRRSAD